jgi:hypothetical protein
VENYRALSTAHWQPLDAFGPAGWRLLSAYLASRREALSARPPLR